MSEKQVKIYGYARVSTREQNEDRQIIALKEMGVPEKNIYLDKLSGKNFDRPQYKKLLKKLDDNSVLYIKSIDRLGRSYRDLSDQWQLITKDKGADVVVIDMPVLDTRLKLGRPPKALPSNFYKVYQQWSGKKISVSEAAKECGMPRSTFYYKAKVYKNAKYENE